MKAPFRFPVIGNSHLMSYFQDNVIINLTSIQCRFIDKLAEVIISLGGIIFGGYPRDNVMNETQHYIVIPKDLDIFIKGNGETVEKFYQELDSLGFEISTRKIDHPTRYGFPYYVGHHKGTVRIKNLYVLGFEFSTEIDVLFTERSDEPPFGHCDLTCNTLLQDKNGIRLSKFTGELWDNSSEEEYIQAQSYLIQDIKNMHTKLIQPEDCVIYYRALEMAKRGWTIDGFKWFREIQYYGSESEQCFKCSAQFKKETVVKFHCCQIHLHKECFDNMEECPNCKQILEI